MITFYLSFSNVFGIYLTKPYKVGDYLSTDLYESVELTFFNFIKSLFYLYSLYFVAISLQFLRILYAKFIIFYFWGSYSAGFFYIFFTTKPILDFFNILIVILIFYNFSNIPWVFTRLLFSQSLSYRPNSIISDTVYSS